MFAHNSPLKLCAFALLATGTSAAGNSGGVACTSTNCVQRIFGNWKTFNHIGDNTFRLAIQHYLPVDESTGSITYKYNAGITCKEGTDDTFLKWGGGQDNPNLAEAAAAAVTNCVIDDTAKTVVCTAPQGVTSTNPGADSSVVLLYQCHPLKQAFSKPDTSAKTSSDDAWANGHEAFYFATDNTAGENTLVVVKPTATEAKVGEAEFVLEFTFTAGKSIAVNQKVTVLAPGYTQNIGGTCTFGTTGATSSTATNVAGADAWTFISSGATITTTETTLKCTKVQAKTAMAATAFFGVISGADVSTVVTAGWVASPIIAPASTTTTTTTKMPTDDASTTTLSAAALLLAASLYL